jgi:hypothetical protein
MWSDHLENVVCRRVCVVLLPPEGEGAQSLKDEKLLGYFIRSMALRSKKGELTCVS